MKTRKTREDYLEMVPEYIDYSLWADMVNKTFDSGEVTKRDEDFLEELFNEKPRTMLERWLDDAEGYKEPINRK